MASPRPVVAGERYAVIVTGASGGEPYAQKYDAWRKSFVATLHEKLGYADDHLYVCAEHEGAGVRKATRANIQRVLGDLRAKLGRDDQLLVLLVGHGATADGDEAKFNLVGPDLSATEWADLLKPVAGTLVFVNTASASFPFLRKLAARGRIVLTATDSAAQQFETMLPEFLVKAFDDPAADADKNGRVSVWEAFSYASAGVRQWYEQLGRLPTERALLDDTGAGIGREFQAPGSDGALARATYLAAPVAPPLGVDATRAMLLTRRGELEHQIEQLQARKATMPADQYAAALEKLLLETARITQQLQAKP